MKSPYFVGIDIGTYESKGALIDGRGDVVATHSEKHGMENPAPNHFEHDAEAVWWGDFCKISKALLEKSAVDKTAIAAVGASALGADLLAVDKDTKPLRKAILYGIDARATEEIGFLNDCYGLERVLAFNGRPLCSNDIPPKMLWLKNHEPEIHKKAHKLITASTYLTAKLTGEYVLDRFLGLGSFSPLYDPGTLMPDDAYLPMFCRADQLADIRDTVDIAGFVTSSAAKETHLAEGTPVIVGGDDSSAEAIGTGVLEVGDLMLQFGSSLFLIALSEKLVRDRRIWSSGFIIPNINCVMGGTNAAGTLTRWYRDNVFIDALEEENRSGTNAYQSMMSKLHEIPAGSDGLITLPYIAGERTPINDPKAKGAIFGLSIHHTRNHLYRSALESIGYGVAQHLDIFAENGIKINNIYAVGGGVKNRVWMQIVSDICGCDLLTDGVALGASYGDALMAAIGVGYIANFSELRKYIAPGASYAPNADNHDKYKKYRALFEELYAKTRGMAHAL
ncbi:MAG: carbohydrate kinase [Clostridiales Family XIII bacterium]|jgi:xylulokinase|nr:carbohydrate kinase [Clostridiales Family XIII bacterium]